MFSSQRLVANRVASKVSKIKCIEAISVVIICLAPNSFRLSMVYYTALFTMAYIGDDPPDIMFVKFFCFFFAPGEPEYMVDVVS